MFGLRVFALAAFLLLTDSSARAQQASFDCLQARAPIEMLICSDPELLELDGALGEAIATQRRRLPEPQRPNAFAEQRTWLAERLSRCGIPADGAGLDLETRWRAAPCLDDMYRARLAALRAPPRPAVLPPAGAAEPTFIHPACLWSFVEQDMEPTAGAAEARIALAACARGNRHIPVTEGEQGSVSASGASDGYRTWLTYRILGTVADGRQAAVIWYNSGGTGEFSEIYLLRRTPAPDGQDVYLTGELVAGGGDRCNGGIDEAQLVNAHTMEVVYDVTPLDLLSEADEVLADENMERLALCAICCTGTVRRRLDLDDQEETTISATVDQLLSREADGGSSEPAQACFDDVIGKAAGSLPHTFSATELKALAQSFAKSCNPTRSGKNG